MTGIGGRTGFLIGFDVATAVWKPSWASSRNARLPAGRGEASNSKRLPVIPVASPFHDLPRSFENWIENRSGSAWRLTVQLTTTLLFFSCCADFIDPGLGPGSLAGPDDPRFFLSFLAVIDLAAHEAQFAPSRDIGNYGTNEIGWAGF